MRCGCVGVRDVCEGCVWVCGWGDVCVEGVWCVGMRVCGGGWGVWVDRVCGWIEYVGG